MPSFKWTIDLLGVYVDVDVDYRVTSYGTSASWDDPGDPPEIVIEGVNSLLTGADYLKLCENSLVGPASLRLSYGEYILEDPMMCAVLGNSKWAPEQLPPRSRYFYWRAKLAFNNQTILDVIEQAILENEDFTPETDPSDYY